MAAGGGGGKTFAEMGGWKKMLENATARFRKLADEYEELTRKKERLEYRVDYLTKYPTEYDSDNYKTATMEKNDIKDNKLPELEKLIFENQVARKKLRASLAYYKQRLAETELKKQQRTEAAQTIQKATRTFLQKKAFSTALIAQQARKASAKEAEERALREDRPVLQKTTVKKEFAPVTTE